MFPPRATRMRSVKARTLIAFTKMQRVISGSVAGAAVLFGSMNARGSFKHYRHNPDDPNSLISDNVYTIFGDRNGHMWVGQVGGLSRFDPATDGFTNYRPVPDHPASLGNTVWVIYQDRSGTLWLGTWGGTLIRFDDKAKTFVNYTPDPHDPHKLNGGGINTIHEDRTGTLWVGAMDGLYRYNRQSGAFTRYTENQGLPSSTIRCILEDGAGRLWLSTQEGHIPVRSSDGNALETTTCPTACRAMSSVRVVIKAQMGRCSLAAAMGSMHFSLKMSATIPTCRR